MLKNKPLILAFFIGIVIFGLLIWRRFDMPKQLEVTLTAIEGVSDYTIDEHIRRGAFVDTEDAYLMIQFGNDVYIALDYNTEIELEDLGTEGPIVRLHKGRIMVYSDTTPVWITTDTTENAVAGGSATFINYDFLETVHIIPVESGVQTKIKTTGDYLLLPVPIAVTEGNEPGYEPIVVNLDVGDAAVFYEWAESH